MSSSFSRVGSRYPPPGELWAKATLRTEFASRVSRSAFRTSAGGSGVRVLRVRGNERTATVPEAAQLNRVGSLLPEVRRTLTVLLGSRCNDVQLPPQRTLRPCTEGEGNLRSGWGRWARRWCPGPARRAFHVAAAGMLARAKSGVHPPHTGKTRAPSEAAVNRHARGLHHSSRERRDTSSIPPSSV